MIRYQDFIADVERRKKERWVSILAAEPPGRVPGRRPRDPEQEAILERMDRRELDRRAAGGTGLVPPATTGEPHLDED